MTDSRKKTKSEQQLASALRQALGPDDVLFENIRFSDQHSGDVEIDLLLLLAGFGAATIEVKGGFVTYEAGEWLSISSRGRRRVRPIEQARRAKHAFRHFIVRQPAWIHELPNTEWFVALPNTKINGDLGPEGRRQQLIGSNDVDHAIDQIREVLMQAQGDTRILSADDIKDVVALLTRTQANAVAPTFRPNRDPVLLATSITAALGLGILTGQFSTEIRETLLISGLSVLGLGLLYTRLTRNHRRKLRTLVTILGIVVAVCAGLAAQRLLSDHTPTASTCQVGYRECLPVVSDLDCSQIPGVVHVTTIDTYRLDRDGDGIGCEWNLPSTDNP